MFARRRSLVARLVVILPALWLGALLVFTIHGRDSAPAANEAGKRVEGGADKAHGGDTPEKAEAQQQVHRIQGFGPPMTVQVAESAGGDAATADAPAVDADGNRAEGGVQRNIPQPRKFAVEPDSPMYKRGDPAQAGEEGKPVVVNKNELTADERRVYDQGFQDNAFNQYASDKISIHRSLPPNMDKECSEESYPVEQLPTTSVIVCFHNEAWSVLLRTMHSVLERTPERMLAEIILVDDFSDKEHLRQPLDDYMSQYPKVKVLRLQKREGLIRARLKGADIAKGDVLTYLDSHCECMTGWLEPLLDRIRRNSTTVVCPVIDVIDDNTFQYHYSKAYFTNVGGFDWSLQFNWHAIPERDRKNRKRAIDPVPSPTMAGGLFAIDRKFFERLGKYDDGFDIWGGENLELSFKTWMCGGRLEIVPCSHVGHIFRKRSPYKWRSGVNVLKRNSIRLAEVWLDDYKQYYYERINNNLGDFGDVSGRKKLRDDLQCKSFRWYLDTIYPELFVPGDAIAKGEVRNLALNGKMCLDSPVGRHTENKPVGLYPCHGQGGNQYWMLSKDGEIRRDESCVDYAGQDVMIYPCHGMKGNQEWLYDNNLHQLRHRITGKCLEMTKDGAKLEMAACEPTTAYQQWQFKQFDGDKARQYGYNAGGAL